jgi:hypothetical protein
MWNAHSIINGLEHIHTQRYRIYQRNGAISSQEGLNCACNDALMRFSFLITPRRAGKKLKICTLMQKPLTVFLPLEGAHACSRACGDLYKTCPGINIYGTATTWTFYPNALGWYFQTAENVEALAVGALLLLSRHYIFILSYFPYIESILFVQTPSLSLTKHNTALWTLFRSLLTSEFIAALKNGWRRHDFFDLIVLRRKQCEPTCALFARFGARFCCFIRFCSKSLSSIHGVCLSFPLYRFAVILIMEIFPTVATTYVW